MKIGVVLFVTDETIAPAVLGPALETFRRVRSWLAEQGRPDVPFTAFGADPDPLDVNGFDEVGVDRVALWVDPLAEHEVLSRLDAIAERWLR